jgi:hypothetical protein
VPNPIDHARQLIHSRLAELDAEVKSLERALRGLGENTPTRRSTPRSATATARPASPAARKRRRAKRAPRGQRQEQLLAAIKATPGARPSELAKAIGIKPAQVHALIAKARAEKLISKQGKGYALKS